MDIMNLIPAPYQAPVMAGLAALVAITHAMAFFQPTSGIAGKIGAVLNALAGNYGKATNADAPATPPAAPTALKLVPVLLAAGIAASLSACQPPTAGAPVSTPQAKWAAVVGQVQTLWPIAKSIIAIEVPNPPEAVVNFENAFSADVAALNPATPPTSLASFLADGTALINALPTTTMSAEHKAQIDLLAAAISAAAAAL
jgi:hypothetical protein